jgi:adenosylmethionine-8-amino-7-oxononanoate aminotransferase
MGKQVSLRKAASSPVKEYLFNKNKKSRPSRIVSRGHRHSFKLEDGTILYDASCGAAAANLGRYHPEVADVVNQCMALGISYVPSLALGTPIAENLARFMIESTNGKMSKAIFYSSGLKVQHHFTTAC